MHTIPFKCVEYDHSYFSQNKNIHNNVTFNPEIFEIMVSEHEKHITVNPKIQVLWLKWMGPSATEWCHTKVKTSRVITDVCSRASMRLTARSTLCYGNPPSTGRFPSQMAIIAERVPSYEVPVVNAFHYVTMLLPFKYVPSISVIWKSFPVTGVPSVVWNINVLHWVYSINT